MLAHENATEIVVCDNRAIAGHTFRVILEVAARIPIIVILGTYIYPPPAEMMVSKSESEISLSADSIP